MVARRIFIVGMCFVSTYSAGMDLVEIKEHKERKIRSFDAAQVLANSSTLDQWKTYSFNSRALAEIIKKDGVVDCHRVVTEEECAMIKLLKKENDGRYSLLIEGIYTLLRGSTNDTLQNLKFFAMSNEQDEHNDKQKELERMRGLIAYCDEKQKSDEDFWGKVEMKALIGALIVVEVVAGITTVLSSVGCWN